MAYKNVIGARRASWRIISSIEQKEENKGNETQVQKIKAYRQKVETELSEVCSDILAVLDEHLIPSAEAGESKVFYYKMWVQLPILIVFCHPYYFLERILLSAGQHTIDENMFNQFAEHS